MKKTYKPLVGLILATAVFSTTAFACTTAPRPNITRGEKVQPVKPETKPTPKPEVKPETKPEVKPETKPTPKPEVKPETKPTPKPEVKPETKPTPKPEVKPETKPTPKPECKPQTKPTPKPECKPEMKPFEIDNFKMISGALEKLGVSQDALNTMIKEGKKLPEVLKMENIKVKCFKKALINQYNEAINQGVKNGQLTKAESKMLKSAIKEKVMSWLKQ